MTHTPQRGLTAHEKRFIEQLRITLRDLPPGRRKVLLAAAEQNVAERPRTAGWEELVGQLGQPEEYAAELRSDLENLGPGVLDRARRQQRTNRRIVAALIALLVAAAGLGLWRWQTWQAGFTANTSAVCVDSAYHDGCDQTGVVSRSNPFGDVAEVVCTPGTEVTVVNGIVSTTPVTITGVDVGLPEGAGSIFRLDKVEPWPMRQLQPGLRGNPAPGAWPMTIGPNTGETLLSFHFTLQCPPWMSAGHSTTLLDFHVHYHAWGKDRITTMPFQQALQITGRNSN